MAKKIKRDQKVYLIRNKNGNYLERAGRVRWTEDPFQARHYKKEWQARNGLRRIRGTEADIVILKASWSIEETGITPEDPLQPVLAEFNDLYESVEGDVDQLSSEDFTRYYELRDQLKAAGVLDGYQEEQPL